MASTPDPPHLELVCFGPPTARLDGRDPPPDVLWRKHLALLVYLALSPGRERGRDHLLGLLWPEKTESQARHSLNEAVRRLRTSLGAARLVSRGDAIALAETGLEVDALGFDATAAGEPARAAALLRGDFLEGLNLADAPAFEEWAAGERARYRARGAEVLVALGEVALAGGRLGDAQAVARRALALQPYTEPVARLLMRAAALADDRAGALAAFHEFHARLEKELGEQPSRELTALAERVRSRRWKRRAEQVVEEEPPLVGRSVAHQEAFRVIAEGLGHGPRTLLITGDPGMGKTRLLTECLDRLALEGAAVASAWPLESDQDAPWSTLRSLVRGGLLNASGSAAAAPEALGVLGAIAPELAGRAAPRPPRDHAEVAAALSALLRAVADEQPLALAVDAAHFADGATLAALGAAVAGLPPSPVVLLLASIESSQDAPRELLALRGEIGRRLSGAVVRLAPLAEHEVRELVAALAPWCADEDGRRRLTRRLVFETAGNPFLAVTLLRSLRNASAFRVDVLAWPPPRATMESPLPISVPNLARMSVMVRVAELEEGARTLLRAASIGGLALDLDLLTALTGRSRAEVEDQLPVLERHQFIAFDGARYAFAAPLIAHVVRNECMSRGERQTYRSRAIAALGGRQDLESRVLRAELLAKADPGRGTFDEAVAVARSAIAAGAARTARRAVVAAERCLGTGDLQDAERRVLEGVRAALER